MKTGLISARLLQAIEFHSKNGVSGTRKSDRVQEKNPAGPHKSGRAQEKQPEERPGAGISDRQIHVLEEKLRRTGVGMDAVKGRYGFDKPQDMSGEMYTRVMQALAKTKTVNQVA